MRTKDSGQGWYVDSAINDMERKAVHADERLNQFGVFDGLHGTSSPNSLLENILTQFGDRFEGEGDVRFWDIDLKFEKCFMSQSTINGKC